MRLPRLFRKHTGLWTLKHVLEELHGVRCELAMIRVALEEHLRKPVASIQIGQGFRTARPEGAYEGEPGGVEYSSDDQHVAYCEIASRLFSKMGRTPTTEEIEREYLLRYQG